MNKEQENWVGKTERNKRAKKDRKEGRKERKKDA